MALNTHMCGSYVIESCKVCIKFRSQKAFNNKPCSLYGDMELQLKVKLHWYNKLLVLLTALAYKGLRQGCDQNVLHRWTTTTWDDIHMSTASH